MARGRMISKSLSTSEKRAALHEEAGKLAEFCQALYPLLIAHADDFGRLQGDVFTVKHLVDPTSPRKLAEFKDALIALHNVGLIVWYQPDTGDEGDQKRFIAISGFAAHQNLRGHDKDGRKSPFPDPPQNPSKIEGFAQNRPNAPKGALTKEKRTELKRTEPIQSPPEPGTGERDEAQDTRTADNHEVRAFIARFCELYGKHRHGARYYVRRERDVPTLRRLLSVYPRDRLEKLAVVLLTTDDDWVTQTDRGIGILSAKASWLDGLLASYEAQHGAIRVAS
jgi:hypothetical protein